MTTKKITTPITEKDLKNVRVMLNDKKRNVVQVYELGKKTIFIKGNKIQYLYPLNDVLIVKIVNDLLDNKDVEIYFDYKSQPKMKGHRTVIYDKDNITRLKNSVRNMF